MTYADEKKSKRQSGKVIVQIAFISTVVVVCTVLTILVAGWLGYPLAVWLLSFTY